MRPSTRIRVLISLFGAVLLAPCGVAHAESCPNQAIRAEQGVQEGAAHSLPACRAYELASPPLKDEEEVSFPDQFNREVSFEAAEQGGAVQYTLSGGIPESQSSGEQVAAISHSSQPGASWATMPLAPNNYFESLHSGPDIAGEFEHFSPQLTCGVEETRLALAPFNETEEPQLAPGESIGEGIENLYEWNAPGEYTLITSVRPTNPNATGTESVYYVDGASSDCGTVLYETTNSHGYNLPGAPGSSLYEWRAGASFQSCRHTRGETPAGCAPQVASVLPDGTDAGTVVDPAGATSVSDLNEVSNDGSRLFFTAASDGGGESESLQKVEGIDDNALQIYLREDGETRKAVSLSQSATPIRDTGAKFEAASSDGDKVFFVANYGLTGADGSSGPKSCNLEPMGSGKEAAPGFGCDLYEYDIPSEKLTDLSSDTGDPTGADVRGVLGIAENGSVVYFSSTGQLITGEGNSAAENEATEGTTHSGAKKTEPEANVYEYSGGTLRYVATIGEAEAGGSTSVSGNQNALLETDAISGREGMKYYAARVAEDGQYLMLATRHQLTEYDNAQPTTGTPEWEEYEYSNAARTVTCVSCNPTGAAPVADGNEAFAPLGVYIPVQAGVIPRNLLNDGRVFFDSMQPLQASAGGTSFTALNRTVNPYEWTPEGLDGCVAPAQPEGAPPLHGCLALLDTGAESERFPTYVQDASPDGDDVYITTHAQLAPQDQDGLVDVYDVRVDGGIPAPPAPPSCSEDLQSCQSAGAGLALDSLGSESSAGGGNPSGVIVKPPGAGTSGGTAGQGVKAFAKRKIKGTSVTISVTASSAGRITAHGAGFKTTRKSVSKPGVYRLKASLSAKERKALKHKHKLTLKLLVSFAPASGRASSASMSITFT